MRDRPAGAALRALAERARAGEPGLAVPADARYRELLVARAEAIAERQSQAGAGAERRELDRLKRLVGGDGNLAELNRALAVGIRAGAFDPGAPEADAVRRHLWETVLTRVGESNPKALPSRDGGGDGPGGDGPGGDGPGGDGPGGDGPGGDG